MSSKVSNGESHRPEPTDSTELRPLNARSLALSVLLGTYPPELSSGALVRVGELFGIAPGTMRTALSRLAADATLVSADGRYRLSSVLVDRQRSQDVARTSPGNDWDGTWHTVIAADNQRDLADRREFRALMSNYRFGELRPDLWMRPANELPPVVDETLILTTGPCHGRSDDAIVAQLWDLDRLVKSTDRLAGRCEQQLAALDPKTPSTIVDAFQTLATTIRFLRQEPRLPAELQPDHYQIDALRATFLPLEVMYRAAIVEFLSSDRDRGSR